ncbi:helix-hairpin-helix domain-containing protein [Chitinophaga filiformis]|uniref:ComEA family DNA-binding protein n=1 Tax=Chitinophaga filiformis TaxID=104663 RepID=UPI001F370E37|nr:helix-hairpin-helix domain-containing protein [Chitinophaga filiformis]MCF6403860.1 helix-hairpin-helix domain-containing protein [Chitinophaga filiformis]
MPIKIAMLILLLLLCNNSYAQQPEPALNAVAESQLEGHAANADNISEDDGHWQQLQGYTRRKIDLNTADAAALKSLGILSPVQIRQFLAYRQQMGKLVSIYELQAVPGWDEQLIRSILPYVRTGNDLEPRYTLKDYLKRGDHTLLFRYGRQLETSRGYQHTDSTSAHYLGSPDRLLLRYRYNFPRYMSWGVVMEKDAGEAFFRGGQGRGFDFYSIHLFVRQYKWIRALALGDFTVNMGQGLLNWQSLAFGKGAAVMQVKREGELLKPYASAGEYNFYRGAGVTVAQGKWEGTAFISSRMLDGSITENSGYHRSHTELAKRHTLGQYTIGGNVTVTGRDWRAGLNMIQHQFSQPVVKGTAPYQLFAFEGKTLTGVSADYEASWKGLHLFGEGAMSANGKTAWISGLLASVTANVDMVLLYRNYNRGYHSLYADAWGEFYKPVNENGVYTGISLKVNTHLKIDAYADQFRFPWLQYRSSAPGGGRDLLVALTYTPDKQTEIFLRYNYTVKQQDGKDDVSFFPPPVRVDRQSWRLQVKLDAKRGITVKNRVELSRRREEGKAQRGFLLFQELLYACTRWPLQLYVRYTMFAAGEAESMYTITSGMLYEYAVSRLSGEGRQYQCRMRWKMKNGLTCWIRYQRTVYGRVTSIGNGWDEVAGNRVGDLHCQLQYSF